MSEPGLNVVEQIHRARENFSALEMQTWALVSDQNAGYVILKHVN